LGKSDIRRQPESALSFERCWESGTTVDTYWREQMCCCMHTRQGHLVLLSWQRATRIRSRILVDQTQAFPRNSRLPGGRQLNPARNPNNGSGSLGAVPSAMPAICTNFLSGPLLYVLSRPGLGGCFPVYTRRRKSVTPADECFHRQFAAPLVSANLSTPVDVLR
jgi:hypothetical protein